jgi:hypothetical protein
MENGTYHQDHAMYIVTLLGLGVGLVPPLRGKSNCDHKKKMMSWTSGSQRIPAANAITQAEELRIVCHRHQ